MVIEATNVKPPVYLPEIKITRKNGGYLAVRKQNDGTYTLYSAAPPGQNGFLMKERIPKKEALGEILRELYLMA